MASCAGLSPCPICGGKVRGLLGFEALAHELLALVTLEFFGLGVGVAGFHFVLLGGTSLGGRGRSSGLGAQALAHELFALIAFEFFGFGIGVAGRHFVLLVGSGLGTAHGQRKAQSQSYQYKYSLHISPMVKK